MNNTQRAKHIFIRHLLEIKLHGIHSHVFFQLGEIKRGGSVDDGKWDGLSRSPLTTNLARHDGFELLMTLLLVLVVVVAHSLTVLPLL